jgi:energy-converting hydrogenase Eha subunit A
VVWIWIFYAPHTWNMPEAVQDRLIEGSLNPNIMATIGNVLVHLNNIAIFKPLVQYALGLAMVFTRVTSGNVTYFNGEVTDQSFHSYFPELFMVKTQVALILLLIVAVAFGLYQVYSRRPLKLSARFKAHFQTHVLEWTLGAFAVFYFGVSTAGNLNLGIRHILPVYLPIFILVAVVTVKRLRFTPPEQWRRTVIAVVALLLVWYGGSTVANHPHYISYFNELIGGSGNAGKYFSDSSVDWGQDLRRLKTYVDQHPEINHIAVDYFGGGLPEYYFCQRKFDDKGKLIMSAEGYDCSNSVYEAWHVDYGEYTGQYIAVSETFLENDRWYSKINGTPGYEYLRQREPVAKIGYSIYVYKMY